MTCLPGINDHKSKASSYVFGNAIHFSSHSLFRVLYLFLLLRLPTPLFFPYAQLIIWLMILPRRENHWEMVSLSFHQIWLMCYAPFWSQLFPLLSSFPIHLGPLVVIPSLSCIIHFLSSWITPIGIQAFCHNSSFKTPLLDTTFPSNWSSSLSLPEKCL